MCESIQQCRRHLLVYKYRRPFSEAKIGRDDDARALVEFADQVEQQSAACLTDRQVTQFIEYDEIGVDETVGDTALVPLSTSPNLRHR
ncbi:MAG: hypothetical protein Cons2KO_33250 [Congregibacter sp.]